MAREDLMRSALCIVFVATAACGGSSSSGDDIPASCGTGAVDLGEQVDDGNDNAFDGCRPDCTAVDKLEPTPMAWRYYDIEGTKCIDGTPAGFSVNYNPAATKVLIYMEGGGACFNQFCAALFMRSGKEPGN